MSGLRRWFKAIWTDVRHGRDIELYVTVPLALVVIILSLLGVASNSLVSGLTLAVLAVLATTLLRLSRQDERLKDAVDRVSQPSDLANRFFWAEHDDEMVKKLILSSRNEVWLWGATLSMHVSEMLPYIEEVVRRGTHVKMLLIAKSPSASMTMASLRAGHPDDLELSHELSSNLIKLRNTARRLNEPDAKRPRGQLEVRLLDYLAPYTLYAYDPESLTGQLEMRLGGLRSPHRFRPGFTLHPTLDGVWYTHFKEQFEAAWILAAEEVNTSAIAATPDLSTS